MTPKRWQQIKAVFNSALEYGPAQRSSFLSEACDQDAALREEVESLLAAHEKDGSFIDAPACNMATDLEESVALEPGHIAGSYEVDSFIGRGGMGEVYLAHDTRLRRKVALKQLPASFKQDESRRQRFEYEARVASALNHPNIIVIYEVFESDSTLMMATEFVDGVTLREHLTSGPLSLNEVLHISIQVADALDAAHKAGIVHRDIKPENVMIRPDGYVKVLDFGLAKVSEEASPATAAEAPTIQVRTDRGIVIGTAGYMSPEQARGLPVDSRSDIFSLGAVIYEMLAQRKPFEGETPSDTLASILRTQPPPLSRTNAAIPPELTRIVTKCLKKDREERYQVVKDLWLDLKALKQELEFQNVMRGSEAPELTRAGAVAGEPTAIQSQPQTTTERSGIGTITESLSIEIKRHKFGAAIVFGIIAVVVAAGTFGIYKLVSGENRVAHFQDVNLARLTNSGNAIDATISPDGKYIVYALSDRSSQSLWIRQVSTANDKLVVQPARVGYFGLTFSPDGSEIYYAVKANLDPGTLYRIPTLGGTPVKLLEKIDGPISFSPDGKQFVLVRANSPETGSSSLVIANTDGTGERSLAVKKFPDRFAPIFFTGPSWSPDGKTVAASVTTLGGGSKVVGFSVADGKEQPLEHQSWQFAGRVQWLPDMSGLLVVAGENPGSAQLWLISYPEGTARRVTNDLSTYRAIGLTQDGKKFTTVQAQGLVNLWVVPDGEAAKGYRLPTGNVSFYASIGNNVAWTPDGRIVFVSTEGGNANIWITSLENDGGSNREQLTANGAMNFSPVVTSDGKYIVFSVWREGKSNLWRMNLDGSNPVQLTFGLAEGLPSVTADSRGVLYIAPFESKPMLWKVSIDGGTPTRVIDHVVTNAVASPDGKLIAYTFPDSTDPAAPPNRIAFLTADGTQTLHTMKAEASGNALAIIDWAPDNKSVIYTVSANNVTNLWSQPIDGGPAKQITDFKEMLMTSFAWSPDGKRLACTRGNLLRDAVLIQDLGQKEAQ